MDVRASEKQAPVKVCLALPATPFKFNTSVIQSDATKGSTKTKRRGSNLKTYIGGEEREGGRGRVVAIFVVRCSVGRMDLRDGCCVSFVVDVECSRELVKRIVW